MMHIENDLNKFFDRIIKKIYTVAAETSSPVQRARKFSAKRNIKTRL